MKNIQALCCLPTASLQDAMTIISRYSKGIALVTDQDGKLLFTVTDGDIRRAILDGQSLNAPVQNLLAYKMPHQLQVTAPIEQLNELLLRRAVVIAGGFGTRLLPLTEHTPKTMLPLGDQPLLARIINSLRQNGIRQLTITTYYHPEKITDYFGNGQEFGVNIEYITETTAMGTAGSLGLMECPDEPFLVINGDILTEMDFQAMYAFHCEQQADFTVGVRPYKIQVPYGVIDIENSYVKGLREKPILDFFVNAGIYLLEPHVYEYIPRQQRFDMTDLIETLIANGSKVASFPIVEYWLDIGQHADYIKAQEDVAKGVLSR